MVAQHIIFARRDHAQRRRNMVAIRFWHIRLVEQSLVYRNLSVRDLDLVSWYANNPLDEGFLRIAREPKHYSIAALDVGNSKAIGKLIDENALLIHQRRHHAGAFDADRLIQEQNHYDRNQHADGQITQPRNRRDG